MEKFRKKASPSPEKVKTRLFLSRIARAVIYIFAAVSTFAYFSAALIGMSDDWSLLPSVYARLTGRDLREVMFETFRSEGQPLGFDITRLTVIYVAVIALSAILAAVLYYIGLRARQNVASAESEAL